MVKKNILICIDRDGTLIFDEKLHIGHTNDWKKKVRILPRVVEGVKLLRKKLPDVKIYMITNQSGVAIRNFKLLDRKRSVKVCEYVLERFRKRGAFFNGFELCGYVDKDYVNRRKDRYSFNEKFVGEFPCIKPRTGMVDSILRGLNWKKGNTDIYVIGDREIDVRTGLNAGGYGVIIPFVNEPGEKEKVEKMKKRNVYIAKDFLDASRYIVRNKK